MATAGTNGRVDAACSPGAGAGGALSDNPPDGAPTRPAPVRLPGAALSGGEDAPPVGDVVPGVVAAPFEPALDGPLPTALTVVPVVLPGTPPPAIEPIEMLPGAADVGPVGVCAAVPGGDALGALATGAPPVGAFDTGMLTGGCDGGVRGEAAVGGALVVGDPAGAGPAATITTAGTGEGEAPCAKSHVHEAVVLDLAGCIGP